MRAAEWLGSIGVEALNEEAGEVSAAASAGSVLVPGAYRCLEVEEGHGSESEEVRGLLVRHSGSVVEVYSRGLCELAGGGVRGRVTEFSGAARRRMFKNICATPLERWQAVPVFSVLTYPHECRPVDAEQAHADLRRFYWRWADSSWGRALDGLPRGWWNMEFTARRAVHWNLLFLVEGTGLTPKRLKQLRADLRATWSAVVNGRCGHEHQVRTSAEPMHGRVSRVAAYFAGYTTKAGGKEYQHQVPEEWDHSGRWWGHWGKLGPEWTAPASIEPTGWFRLRRVLRGARRAQVRQRRQCEECQRLMRPGCGRCRFRRVRPYGRQVEEVEHPPGLWLISREEGGWLAPLAALGIRFEVPA